MSLFPKCTFTFVLASGDTLTAGKRNEGTLVVDVPDHLPRARHVSLTFLSRAWAAYGAGTLQTVERRELLRVPLRFALPQEGLAPGTHLYPFSVDLPAWLPPDLAGSDCGVEHELHATMDVDWALDPATRAWPTVRRPPVQTRRVRSTVTSPSGFHDDLAITVTAPSVVSEDEPVKGQVSVVGEARFDALVVTLARVATIVMARGDERWLDGPSVRIPAAQLRSGEPVRFELPPSGIGMTSFTSGFIDVGYALVLEASVPRRFADPRFSVPVRVVPRGSTIERKTGGTVTLGAKRFHRVAARLASRTELGVGRPPVFVQGREGPVTFTLTDAPLRGAVGAEATFRFPSLGLGLQLLPRGALEALRESPLLPEELRHRYALRCEVPRGRFVEEPLDEATFHRLLEGLGQANWVRMSERDLAFHVSVVGEDTVDRLAALAALVVAKAKLLAELLLALPFPTALAESRSSWTAVAEERGGALIASGPTLAWVHFVTKTLAGDERTVSMTLTTDWTCGAPTSCLELDLGTLALVEGDGDHAHAVMTGRQVDPLLGPLGDTFSDVSVKGPSLLRARARTMLDPRAAFAGGERIVAWVLERRGDRAIDAPYR